MDVRLSRARLRLPRQDDAPALARHLDDMAIWRNLRDRVPQPYTLADAQAFLAQSLAEDPAASFVLEIDSEAAGGMALHALDDVHRRSAEIGFWLGVRWHGLGIMTEAVGALVRHAFARDAALARVEARVFGWNAPSMCVLEKNGFVREGRLRDAVCKDGAFTDEIVYGLLRAEAARSCSTFRC
ncbi:MAG: GNAT family N-acetyltransferase [Planctomycetes bacterium]|nr:GNAT family N-acetyltransferase [Planctomycetota bacterium]